MNRHPLLAPAHGDVLAGWLLVFMIIASVIPGLPRIVAGLCAWSAMLLLSYRWGQRQRLQISWLIGLGIAGLAWGRFSGAPLDFGQILAANQGLVSLLTAVSFLRLVAQPEATAEKPPRGRKALWRTLLGVHLFGAVINLSTVIIFGDGMTSRGRLGKRRALALTRGFGAGAFWSPFFSAMAAALTYAPGAQLGIVVLAGLPMAAISLWLTARELDPANPRLGAPFIGYPMRFSALWIPGLLVAIVLTAHELAPHWSILSIIAVSAPLLTITILLIQQGSNAWQPLKGHIEHGLAGTVNELSLFLAAGVLAAGLTSLTRQLGGWLPFEHFGSPQAALVLVVMTGLATLGVHPIITIAACGVWLAPLHPDPNLLAITLLMAWGIGVPANPLSGLHLIMQGRYRIDSYAFLRWNAAYVLKSLGAGVILLYLYSRLLGIAT